MELKDIKEPLRVAGNMYTLEGLKNTTFRPNVALHAAIDIKGKKVDVTKLPFSRSVSMKEYERVVLETRDMNGYDQIEYFLREIS